MKIDTLNRANAVKKTIDKLECEHSRISKLYSKKEDLTKQKEKNNNERRRGKGSVKTTRLLQHL